MACAGTQVGCFRLDAGGGGRLGLTQQNLFGAGKGASLKWQSGQVINDCQPS